MIRDHISNERYTAGVGRIGCVALLVTVAGCGFGSANGGGSAGLGESDSADASTSAGASAGTADPSAGSASQSGATTNDAGTGPDSATTGTPGSASATATASATESTTGGGPGDSSGEGEDTASTGTSDACAEAGCDANASCDDSARPAACTCNDGFFGDGTSCTAVELATLRVELPCLEQGPCPVIGCAMLETDQDQTSLLGDTEVTYTVTLRFRGVIEEKTYTGGDPQEGYFHPNATPVPGGFNQFGLQVDDPPGTYFLNSGTSGINECFPLDETHQVDVRGGSGLRLFGNNGFDTCGVQNLDGDGAPIVIEDVPPDPAAFDGQFIQVDVVDISAP